MHECNASSANLSIASAGQQEAVAKLIVCKTGLAH
jgi:hypothetical protein